MFYMVNMKDGKNDKKKEQRKSCCSYGYVATNDATIVFILFQIFVNYLSHAVL